MCWEVLRGPGYDVSFVSSGSSPLGLKSSFAEPCGAMHGLAPEGLTCMGRAIDMEASSLTHQISLELWSRSADACGELQYMEGQNGEVFAPLA